MAEARLIPKNERPKALDIAIAACGLTHFRDKRIETLSKGYKQRVGLAQAIIHDPPILILDEPTSGLDPNQIIEIRSLIRELGKRKTVILSTHILQEVEAVCSEVLILNEGRIAAQGTSEEIAGTMKGRDTWDLLLKLPESLSTILAEDLEGLGADPDSVHTGIVEGGIVKLDFTMQDNDGGEKIFDWAVSHTIKILGMERKRLSLEDIFVKLTSEEHAS
jgi:ABC-2 type transport system ATP-binding protein